MITSTPQTSPVRFQHSDAVRKAVEQAYHDADQLVLTSHAGLVDHSTSLEALAGRSADSRANFLATVTLSQEIPQDGDECRRLTLSALTDGLTVGALDATCAVGLHEDTAQKSASPLPPNWPQLLLRKGIEVAEAGSARQKYVGEEMIQAADFFSVAGPALPNRSWRDYLTTVFAVGYGTAATDAALMLIAHQPPQS